MNKFKSFFVVFLMFLFCFSCFAKERDVPAYSDTPYYFDKIGLFFTEGDYDFTLGLTQGYDNNARLNPERKRDGFTQVFLRSRLTTAINKKTDGILEHQIMNFHYYDADELSLMRNEIRAGLEVDMKEDVAFMTNYRFGITSYFDTDIDDFYDHSIEFKCKHDLPDNFYHSLGYELMFRFYEERKARDFFGALADDVREDLRQTATYELGKFFTNDLLKLTFEYYYNNSNDLFVHFYDYHNYNTTASLTHLFSEDLFGYLSFSRRFRSYCDRTLALDPGSAEWDRTYTGSAGLYYNLTENFTIGLNYSYRQNWSNEPLARYSGSMCSLSAYYTF
ncbi:MAG: outer membrane beta-barrel protein [Candidatus Omnitrophica bacterium]|nr:outer membrane beta-barrel protein [Candidatus Omnitrophota bacterium]